MCYKILLFELKTKLKVLCCIFQTENNFVVVSMQVCAAEVDCLSCIVSHVCFTQVFHTLLDLPCVTAALEVMEKAKKSEAPITQGANVEPVSSIEAFHTPARYRPLFSFITRNESGQGDTINK